MSKHRRDSEWSALLCRIRDTCDKIKAAQGRYVGRHRAAA